MYMRYSYAYMIFVLEHGQQLTLDGLKVERAHSRMCMPLTDRWNVNYLLRTAMLQLYEIRPHCTPHLPLATGRWQPF